MKVTIKTIMIILAIVFALSGCVSTPVTYDNPADYMNAIYEFTSKIQGDMWEYVRTSAHIKDPARVDATRKKVIATVENTITKVNKIEPYDNDFVFKNGVLEYLQIQLVILKEDYGKIMDMQEIAEQSYDLMEAYLLAKKVANQKMEDAGKALEEKEKIFAHNHNVELKIESNETTEKLKKAGEVMDYYNEIYLIFFKSFKQEWYIIDALNNQDISKIEQNRQTLIKYADEGLKNLSVIQAYNDDDSVRTACKEILEYYKREAVESIPVFLDYMEKMEAFEQFKQTFEKKKDSEKTQEDVDTYNAKVGELNDAVKIYDKTIREMNTDKQNFMNTWNNASDVFIDIHVPS